MAIRTIYFNYFYTGGTVRHGWVKYDDEAHQLVSELDYAGDGTHGSAVSPTPFLNQDDSWTTLYKQYDNSYKYIVRVRSLNTPFDKEVVETPYTPLTCSVAHQDVSAFGEDDGSITVTANDGTGEPLSVVWQGASSVKTLTRNNLKVGNYKVIITDEGDFTQFIFEVYVAQPGCDLMIIEVETTPESGPGSLDGVANINANSSNTLEYSLDNENWQSSNEFTGLDNGDYTVYVRDVNQPLCNKSKSFSLTETPCDIAINQLIVKQESWEEEEDGSVIVNATSQRAMEFSLDGENWQVANEFVGLRPGNYLVYARDVDVNGCIVSEVFYIDEGDTVEVGTTDVVCGNSPEGYAVITVGGSGNNGPYEYLWEDGYEGDSREHLRAGTYRVTITNKHGDSKQVEFTIGGNPALVVTATTDEDDINISVSGGVPPYTYQWSDGSTAQNRTNLEPGEYTITVHDSVGCSKSKIVKLSPPRHYFSENPVVLELEATDLPQKDNLSFICNVFVELEYMSGEFTRVHSAEQPAEDDGTTVFDVQDVLNAYVEKSLPDLYQAGIRREDKLFKRFYLESKEKYGTPPVEDTGVQINTFYVLLGGLSFEETAEDTFFLSYLKDAKPFYTWQPVKKTVLTDQPEYLYFLVNDFLMTSFAVMVHLFYADGSDEIRTLFTQSDLNRFEVYSFPVGVEQLQLLGYNCQILDRYQIWVENQADVIVSEIREFILEYREFDHRKYFLYLNSLGCMDVLAATGRAEYRLKARSETVEKLLPAGRSAQEAQVEVLRKYGEENVQVPVGYVDKELLVSYMDFIISPAVYMLRKGKWYPVTIEADDTVADEYEDVLPFSFQYSGPRVEKYTPMLREAVVPELLNFTVDQVQEASGENADGAITVAVSGGTPPYTFLWEDGPTSQNRTGLVAGTYSVRVLDSSVPKKAAKICGIVVGDTADPADNFAAEADITHATVAGGSDGAIDVTVFGGVPPYTFAWGHGPATEDVSGLAAGTYQVTITDSSTPTPLEIVLDNLEVEEPVTFFPFFTEGTFEDTVAGDVTDIGREGDVYEIVTSPVQEGSKALKVTKADGNDREYFTLDAYDTFLGNNDVAEVTCYIYIPSSAVFGSETSNPDIAVRLAMAGSQTYVNLGSIHVRDTWQLLKTRSVCKTTNGTANFQIRNPGGLLHLTDGTVFYIDNIQINKIQ